MLLKEEASNFLLWDFLMRKNFSSHLTSSFPASRGLSRRGTEWEKGERLSLSFLSFLPRRERPVLAGKLQAALNAFRQMVSIISINVNETKLPATKGFAGYETWFTGATLIEIGV